MGSGLPSKDNQVRCATEWQRTHRTSCAAKVATLAFASSLGLSDLCQSDWFRQLEIHLVSDDDPRQGESCPPEKDCNLTASLVM